MLYVFGLECVGVVVGDLYFLDPHPGKGQEGAEHGVRLELRVLGRGALKGPIYSAQRPDGLVRTGRGALNGVAQERAALGGLKLEPVSGLELIRG